MSNRDMSLVASALCIVLQLFWATDALGAEVKHKGLVYWIDFTHEEISTASRVAPLLPDSPPSSAAKVGIAVLKTACAAGGHRGASIIGVTGLQHTIVVPTPYRDKAVNRVLDVGEDIKELNEHWGGIVAANVEKAGKALAQWEKHVRNIVSNNWDKWTGKKKSEYGRVEYKADNLGFERCAIICIGESDEVAIRFHTGYLSDQAWDRVVASAPHIKEYERWRIYKGKDDIVAIRSLKTSNSFYLSSGKSELGGSRAYLKAMGEDELEDGMPKEHLWGERFRLIPDGETGGYFLMCTGDERHGQYLSARP